MTTSARVQMFLGLGAAFAAYLLLIGYNGGHINIKVPSLAEAPRDQPVTASRGS